MRVLRLSSPHAIAGDIDPFPTLLFYDRWIAEVWIVSGRSMHAHARLLYENTWVITCHGC